MTPPMSAGPVPAADPGPLARVRAPSSRAWVVAYGAIAAVTAARIPAVTDHVRSVVDESIAEGPFEGAAQRDLAINIGVVTAFALTLLLTLVVMAVARRLEPSLALPDVAVGSWTVSGVLLVVAGVLGAKQLAMLVTGATNPRQDPLIWGAVLASLVAAVVVLARQARTRRALVRTLGVAGVVGAVSVVW